MVESGLIGGLAVIAAIVLSLTFVAMVIVSIVMVFMTLILSIKFGALDFWLYTGILAVIFNIIGLMILYEALR